MYFVMASQKSFPKASRHSSLEELFSDVFFVRGSLTVKTPLPFSFSRSMTIVRSGESLTLINTMRLSDTGLAELDKLGKVENVIRLAGFHGRDDPFYAHRYGATVWIVPGMSYHRGFKPKGPSYFTNHRDLLPDQLVIPNAHLHVFDVTPPEGALLLKRDGGILIVGDSLQNWATVDEYFNFIGKVMMKRMGFIRPCNVGPGWVRETQPTTEQLRSILKLDFDHVLPAHGTAVVGGAREKFRPAIERYRPKPPKV